MRVASVGPGDVDVASVMARRVSQLSALRKDHALHRWACDIPDCDGEPHEGFKWCDHENEHLPSCRHARADQRLPLSDWDIFLLMAGRGSGKTRAGAEAVFDLILTDQISRIALVSRTPADVRDVMIGGDSGLLSVARRRGFTTGPHSEVWHIASQSRVVFNLLGHKAVANTYAATVPDALRGPNFDFGWADEPAAWEDAHRGMSENTTWTNLRLALRVGETRARLIATTTPKRVRLIRDILTLERVEMRQVATSVNAKNLSPQFVETLHRAYSGTVLERQELLGELVEDVQGALWSMDQLAATRYRGLVEDLDLSRIVVGVDPAGSAGGDETGIVVVGRDLAGHGYILDDVSGQMSPSEMARRVASVCARWQADRIIAEGNFGGEMVKETLRVAEHETPIEIVHASRGKRPRAEPVSSLSGDPSRPTTWENARLHVVGELPALEEQISTWTDDSKESPGRLDALVWAVHGLSLVTPLTGVESFLRAFPETAEVRKAAPLVIRGGARPVLPG